jgi:hypothetical protein
MDRHPFTALAVSTPSYLLFLAMALLRFLLSPAPPLLLRILIRSHSFVFSLAFLVQCGARLPFLLAALWRFYKRTKPFHRPEILLLLLRGYLLRRKSSPFFRCFARFLKPRSKKRQGVVFIARGILKHPKAFLDLFRTRKDVNKVRRSRLLLCSAACFFLLVLPIVVAFIPRGVLKHLKAFACFLPGFCKYLQVFLTLYRHRKDIQQVRKAIPEYRRSLLLLCRAMPRKQGTCFCFLALLLAAVLAAQRSHLLPGNISFPLSLVGLTSSSH